MRIVCCKSYNNATSITKRKMPMERSAKGVDVDDGSACYCTREKKNEKKEKIERKKERKQRKKERMMQMKANA